MDEVEPSTEEYAPSEESSTSPSSGDETAFPKSRSISAPRRNSSSSVGVASRGSNSAGRKRRSRDGSVASSKGVKRRREVYCSDYQQLYNETVRRATYRPSSHHDEERFDPGRLGFTAWSSGEKGVFFKALQRKGRDDIPGISRAVGTKSEAEVQVYLQALREGLAHSRSEHIKDLGFVDIPAASDISPDCESPLEAAANWLAAKQDQHERSLEENRHREFWRLGHDNLPAVNRLHEEPVTDASQSQAKAELHDAASLLNLEEFLRLSVRIFMNPTDIENNWRSYAAEDERPSILCTAFIDLYNLVIVTTKRLVLSTLLIASSRIKGQGFGPHDPSAIVNPNDVEAALQVVRLNVYQSRYWIDLARRCKLTVYDDLRPSRLANAKLSYDQVEAYLEKLADSGEGGVPLITREDLDRNTANDTGDHFGEADDLSPHQAESSSGHGSQQSDNDDTEDKLAEAQDVEASRREELRLRKILRMEPLSRDHETGKPSFQPELTHGFPKSDARDWRSLTRLRREWETLDQPIPHEAFGNDSGKSSRSDKQFVRPSEAATVEPIEELNEARHVEEDFKSPRVFHGGYASSDSSELGSVVGSDETKSPIEAEEKMDENG